MIRHGQGESLYVCPICGSRQFRAGRFVEVPENERVYKGQEIRLPEFCGAAPHPDADHETGLCNGTMVWHPETSAHDLLPNTFGEVDIDGERRQFSSLTEVRNYERESERRANGGDGAIHVFRGLSQGVSNKDVNSLAGSTHERAKSERPNTRTVQGREIAARAYNPDQDR